MGNANIPGDGQIFLADALDASGIERIGEVMLIPENTEDSIWYVNFYHSRVGRRPGSR